MNVDYGCVIRMSCDAFMCVAGVRRHSSVCVWRDAVIYATWHSHTDTTFVIVEYICERLRHVEYIGERLRNMRRLRHMRHMRHIQSYVCVCVCVCIRHIRHIRSYSLEWRTFEWSHKTFEHDIRMNGMIRHMMAHAAHSVIWRIMTFIRMSYSNVLWLCRIRMSYDSVWVTWHSTNDVMSDIRIWLECHHKTPLSKCHVECHIRMSYDEWRDTVECRVRVTVSRQS